MMTVEITDKRGNMLYMIISAEADVVVPRVGDKIDGIRQPRVKTVREVLWQYEGIAAGDVSVVVRVS